MKHDLMLKIKMSQDSPQGYIGNHAIIILATMQSYFGGLSYFANINMSGLC